MVKKPFVCARCGGDIPRDEAISSYPLPAVWRVKRYHETCAIAEGEVEPDEVSGSGPPIDNDG